MLDLETLNKPQREAVVTTEGPLLVLAGAGSGKTRVLTYRIAYILDSGLAGPHNILAMTFTNKAAQEMKERILELLSNNDLGKSLRSVPWMGTFHSICVRILRLHGDKVGISSNFTIYDSSDSLQAVKEAMNKLNISTKEFNPYAVRSYISSAKNELVTPMDYESFAQGYFQQTVAEIYPVYQKILRENNAVDFDDLLMYVAMLFEKNKEVLQKYREQFRYILVDEYQDTNHAQYVIVNALASEHKNICCVGDDDQSIYAFRGATIKNILSFEKDYPEATVIKLEQNYRSTKTILEAAHQVISKNKGRKDKKLWTDNDDGEMITIYTASDQSKEAEWVTEKIDELDCSYDDIAILYRTNAQSRSLEEALMNRGMSYRIVGSLKFYDRREIKDILAYLKIIYNPDDTQSLERMINMPRRGIGPKTFSNLMAAAQSEGMNAAEYLIQQKSQLEPKLSKVGKMLDDFFSKANEINILELIEYIIDKSGYLKMLSDGTLENEARIENIKELMTVASTFAEEEPWDSLSMFLENVALVESSISNEDDTEKVTLMTVHAAKGLEFKNVFVVGMEENLFPHVNSIFDPKELEEERRLAYVAITRAKEQLFLTHAKSRLYFGQKQSNPVSRFIEDISTDLLGYESGLDTISWEDIDEIEEDFVSPRIEINVEPGDKVKHEYFGEGKVLNIDDSYIEVDFGGVYGVKELMLEYAKLEKIR